MTIKEIYVTENKSTWSTQQEALVADCLELEPALYLERYKLEIIVKTITKNFLLVPVIETFQEAEDREDVAAKAVSNIEIPEHHNT